MGNWAAVRSGLYSGLLDAIIKSTYTIQEDFRTLLGDMVLLGVMTSALSEGIHQSLRWLDISRHPPIICWEKFPDPNIPLAPLLGYFLSKTDPHNGLVRENIWWKYRPTGECIHPRPYWWEEPIKEVSE